MAKDKRTKDQVIHSIAKRMYELEMREYNKKLQARMLARPANTSTINFTPTIK